MELFINMCEQTLLLLFLISLVAEYDRILADKMIVRYELLHSFGVWPIFLCCINDNLDEPTWPKLIW